MVKKFLLISFIACLAAHSAGCASVLRSCRSKDTLQRGKTYANKRQYAQAESAFLDALRYNPMNTGVWVSLGDIYFTMDHYEEARHAYEEALTYNKGAFRAQAGLWKVYLETTGYTEEARKEVKKEIEDFISSVEKNPEGLMAAYEGLSFLHEYEEALQLAKDIVALVPSEEDLSSLATYTSEELLREKNVEKRIKMIEEFCRLFPSSKEIPMVNTLKLSIAAKDLKDNEALFQYGEEWIRDAPDNRRANFSVGYWYTQEGIALDRAILYLRKALALITNPDPADKPEHYSETEWRKDLKRTKGIYYDTLGWAYYKMGRYKKAEKAYRRGTRYLDYDPNLYYHLGQLLEEKGDMDGAIRAYVQSLKSGENKEAEEKLRKIVSTDFEKCKHCPVPILEDNDYNMDRPLYKAFAGKEGITPFTDVTGEAGLSDIKAIRVAWGDYNSDGYEDILLNGSILLRNNGNGTFANLTGEAGLIATPGSNGGVWGDIDNDGYLDFYTFASGPGTLDRFWANNGDGTFRDITTTAVKDPDPYPTEAAAWGDYDHDGFIDIYVANYEKPLLTTVDRARCLPDRLLRNNGNRTFTDVSATAGTVSLENMCGRGINWGDYDHDGDLDIYVANYRLDPNFLWRNNGDGTFINAAAETGVEGSEQEGYYGHSIGAEWGDYDGDGDLDLFVSNLAHPRYIGTSNKSMLLENQGLHPLPSGEREGVRGGIGVFRFMNKFGDSGIRFEETPADPSFADYDNDGILDLYFTSTYNGRKSFLYKGNGNGTFVDITWLSGVRVDNGWGNAFADYDNDGDLDLLVAGSGGVRLFRNDGNDNHWIHVQVVGRESNRAGIGARVTVVSSEANPPIPPFTKGERGGLQIREVQGGKGSGNQHSLPVEFGLGHYDGTVDVEVRFPSGKIVKLSGISTGQKIVVEEN